MKPKKVLLLAGILCLCFCCVAQKNLPLLLQNLERGWQEIEPGSIYTGEIHVCTPTASGTVVFEDNGVIVDASHTEDGYIMVRCQEQASRLKLCIAQNEEAYTYNLNQEGTYEVYPLQMGNGTYEIQAFQQIEGNQYSQIASVQLEVNMPDPEKAFIAPSQYVWYTEETSAVKLSYDLCVDLSSDAEKVERIASYLANLLSYDYEKAKTVERGYIPDPDEILRTKKGICFDYAALFAVMLRTQNIPVRLVTGYIQPDHLYHAWNQVYIDGRWIWKDLTLGSSSPCREEDYVQEKAY